MRILCNLSHADLSMFLVVSPQTVSYYRKNVKAYQPTDVPNRAMVPTMSMHAKGIAFFGWILDEDVTG